MVEGYRWQMLPVYFYTVLLFLITVRNLKYALKTIDISTRKDRTVVRIIYSTINILLVVIITLPPLLVPIFKLPKPTGPYAVGMKYDYFIDKNRPEPLTENPNDFIEIPVQIWYPAEITIDKKPLGYWENASELSKIIGTFWGDLPPFLFNHFSLIETHSYADAPLSKKEETFPVLIFNHGAIGMPSLNTVLMEELASHGFIIFCIYHTDYVPFFIKPDGQIKAMNPNSEELRSKMKENDDPEVKRIAYQLMRTKKLNKQKELLRQFLQKNPSNQKSLFRWVDDISFTIDVLERRKRGDRSFYNRLNLDKIGVFGVSFGGAASVQVCVKNNRCKAAISMDCIQFGDFLENEMTQPIMFMNSEQYQGINDIFFTLKNNPLYYVSIHNTTHQNFSDISIWGGLFRMQMLGKSDGERCLQIQNGYILAFFKKYLKGIDNQILNASSSKHPEVAFKVKNIK
jgi:dienelactone hydrolase